MKEMILAGWKLTNEERELLVDNLKYISLLIKNHQLTREQKLKILQSQKYKKVLERNDSEGRELVKLMAEEDERLEGKFF
jgi:hypothetical protein